METKKTYDIFATVQKVLEKYYKHLTTNLKAYKLDSENFFKPQKTCERYIANCFFAFLNKEDDLEAKISYIIVNLAFALEHDAKNQHMADKFVEIYNEQLSENDTSNSRSEDFLRGIYKKLTEQLKNDSRGEEDQNRLQEVKLQEIISSAIEVNIDPDDIFSLTVNTQSERPQEANLIGNGSHHYIFRLGNEVIRITETKSEDNTYSPKQTNRLYQLAAKGYNDLARKQEGLGNVVEAFYSRCRQKIYEACEITSISGTLNINNYQAPCRIKANILQYLDIADTTNDTITTLLLTAAMFFSSGILLHESIYNTVTVNFFVNEQDVPEGVTLYETEDSKYIKLQIIFNLDTCTINEEQQSKESTTEKETEPTLPTVTKCNEIDNTRSESHHQEEGYIGTATTLLLFKLLANNYSIAEIKKYRMPIDENGEIQTLEDLIKNKYLILPPAKIIASTIDAAKLMFGKDHQKISIFEKLLQVVNELEEVIKLNEGLPPINKTNTQTTNSATAGGLLGARAANPNDKIKKLSLPAL